MYKSITQWRDLTDGHLYNAGDPYPWDGRTIPDERIEQLSTPQNKAGFALIKAVEITYTPTTGRYSLTIISEDQVATVFSKLSVEDLRYIRGYLLYEIGELNTLKEDN